MLIAILILVFFAFIMAVTGYLNEKFEEEHRQTAIKLHANKVKSFMIHQLYIKGAKKLSQDELDVIKSWSLNCGIKEIRPSDIRTQLIIKKIMINK